MTQFFCFSSLATWHYIYLTNNNDIKFQPTVFMARAYLGEFEEIVLLTVAVLQSDAYGVTVAAELNRRSERAVSLSGVHVALYRLEEKGFVNSELGSPSAERGGRRKRIYIITAYGKRMLAEIRALGNELWESIPLVSSPDHG